MPDKSKMSKRREGSSVKHYRDDGILPAALINYVALLGWNPGTEQELFNMDELTRSFSLEQIQKSGAVFDVEKLRWYNRAYLDALSTDAFLAHARPVLEAGLHARGITCTDEELARIATLIRERMSSFSDVKKMIADGELDFFFIDPAVDTAKVPQKGTDARVAKRHLEHVHSLWSTLPDESFGHAERLKESVWEYASAEGRGPVLWPVRFALSGREKSPDPFMIASFIGKEKTLARLRAATDALAL